jgi:glycosyltransferase involved in cell wall biosynthesis
VVNYRGGEAEAFFRRSFKHVERTLRLAACTVVPSGFLQEIFRKFGADTEIVANIVDLARFSPNPLREFGDAPRIVVTRNLEALYDIGTALRSFARVRESFRAAQLSIAGSGPQRLALEQLAADLGLLSAVEFTGLLKPEQMASLYARADVMLNPSLADNMPNSVLEALASGVPVVSTNVGGVPFLVQDGRSALLVPAADPERMAQATLRILRDRALAAALRANGLELVGAFTWGQVKANWFAVYERALQRNSPDQDLAPSR